MEIAVYIIVMLSVFIHYNLYQNIKLQNLRHQELMSSLRFISKRIDDIENGKLKDIELRVSKINKTA